MKHEKGLGSTYWFPIVVKLTIWVLVYWPLAVNAQEVAGFFQSKEQWPSDSNKTLSLLDNTTPICRDLTIEDTYICNNITGSTDYLDLLTLDSVLVNNPTQKVLSIDSSSFQLNDCNIGEVSYFFRIYNPSAELYSDTCHYKVIVEANHRYKINFPADAVVQCVEPDAPTITTQSFGCDLITVSKMPAQRFNATADECYTELITYRVLNWCEYDGSGQPIAVPTQPNGVEVSVDYHPTLAAADIALSLRENNTETAFQEVTKSTYLASMESGFFQYQQKITVKDNQPPILEVTTPSLTFSSYGNQVTGGCPTSVSITATLRDSCTSMQEDLSIPKAFLDLNNDGSGPLTVDGQPYDYDLISGFFTLIQEQDVVTISAPEVPLGTHAFTLRISDGCGNTATQKIIFSVVDEKAPAPICINGLVVVLSPVDGNGDGFPETAEATLEASDLLASDDLTDCSGPISISLGRLEDTPDMARTTLTYTCADPLLETLPVRVYAWDGAGNYDYCETYIIVEDNASVCEQMSMIGIGGMVLTEDNEPVESVSLSINDTESKNYMTDSDGTYWFNDLMPGYDYTVQVNKEDHPSNGVTTFDLVLISKHILRVRPLGSPYKIIAADANNSGTVTTLDLIHLRRLILRLESELEGNSSWRFIPIDYSFSDPNNPFAENWPEVKNYNNLEVADLNADFIAIKVGDVNGSVRSNSNQPGYRSNYSDKIIFTTPQIQFGKEKHIQVPITAQALNEMEGLQFTLEYDPTVLHLETIESPISGGTFGVWEADGTITFSWIKDGDFTPLSVFSVLDLTFTTKISGRLSEVLAINSHKIEAEAYGTSGEHLGIQIHYFDDSPLSSSNQLLGIWPNPAKEFTQLEYYLNQEESVTFTVTGMNGQILKKWQSLETPGNHQLRLNLDTWANPPGIYWITLATEDWQEQGKLIKIN